MHLADELRNFFVGVDQPLRKFAWMGAGVTNALKAGHRRDVIQQMREISDLAVFHFAAIGIHVLAEQRDFFDAAIGQIGDFGQHVVEAARDFFTARVGYDAKTAILATAFHNGYERGRPFGSRRR